MQSHAIAVLLAFATLLALPATHRKMSETITTESRARGYWTMVLSPVAWPRMRMTTLRPRYRSTPSSDGSTATRVVQSLRAREVGLTCEAIRRSNDERLPSHAGRESHQSGRTGRDRRANGRGGPECHRRRDSTFRAAHARAPSVLRRLRLHRVSRRWQHGLPRRLHLRRETENGRGVGREACERRHRSGQQNRSAAGIPERRPDPLDYVLSHLWR